MMKKKKKIKTLRNKKKIKLKNALWSSGKKNCGDLKGKGFIM